MDEMIFVALQIGAEVKKSGIVSLNMKTSRLRQGLPLGVF
jgi:hypothetical protein